MTRKMTHTIGFDDFAFDREEKTAVPIVGAVFSSQRLDGVLSTTVQRDGDDAAARIAKAVKRSRFFEHNQLIMLQGIALAGFNVVDIQGLHRALEMPVLVVARKQPDLARIKNALLNHVQGGDAKWALIEAAGEMEPVEQVFIQRVGLSLEEATAAIQHFRVDSLIPEPLRTAHIIASGVSTGESRGRV